MQVYLTDSTSQLRLILNKSTLLLGIKTHKFAFSVTVPSCNSAGLIKALWHLRRTLH
jgi:hypothetical protein